MKHIILALVALTSLAAAKDLAPVAYPAPVHCVAEGRKIGEVVTKEKIQLVNAVVWAKFEDGVLFKVENMLAPKGELATISGECMVFAYHDSLPKEVQRAVGGFEPAKAKAARKAREAAVKAGVGSPFPAAMVGTFPVVHLGAIRREKDPFSR